MKMAKFVHVLGSSERVGAAGSQVDFRIESIQGERERSQQAHSGTKALGDIPCIDVLGKRDHEPVPFEMAIGNGNDLDYLG